MPSDKPESSAESAETPLPPKMPLWGIRRISYYMLGDLYAQRLPLLKKLFWLCMILLVPLGVTVYYEKVYLPAGSKNYQIETLMQTRQLNDKLTQLSNDILEIVILLALIGGLIFLGFKLFGR